MDSYLALGSCRATEANEHLDFAYLRPLLLSAEQAEKLKKFIAPNIENILIAGSDQTNSLLNYLDSFITFEHGAKDYAQFKTLLNSSKRLPIVVLFTEDLPVKTPAMAILKLSLISYLCFRPNSLNLDAVFSTLPNLAWTNYGPITLDKVEEVQWKMREEPMPLIVRAIDRIPLLTDYIQPKGVRIGNSAKVRLGAYLGAGTTVMHSGFINFNAGCEGPNMIEGRVSAGVWIAKDSDVGGGASLMGTLSGGGAIKVKLGKNCLLGANSGLGIPLGDNCTIEAGLYLTAGTKLRVLETGQNCKAVDLCNSNNLLFRRNSNSGMVEALDKKKHFSLNTVLHTNS